MNKCYFFIVALWLAYMPTSNAYAILSHEAIIDATWEKELRPLLLKKYPGSTEEQLMEAHAYLYGGAVMPDMGYFPFGSTLFSNLVHYVRTGDFVENLLEEAQNLNEYAFALGFLCHYTADCYGHPLGTNKAEPLLFPCIKKKYGEEVTFEQAKKHHTRTEFSFDVFQVANGQYVSKNYRDFIGFRLSRPLLDRAFLKTYGLETSEIFASFETAESIFRFTVRNMYPALTKASWKMKKRQLDKEGNKIYKKDFIYRTDKKGYKKDYGKPGMKSMGFAFFIMVLPKIGPLSVLRFKVPDEEVAHIFTESFEEIIKQYKLNIEALMTQKPAFKNLNLDTGKETVPGEYEMADLTYYDLLQRLEKKGFKDISLPLKNNITAFYSDKNKLSESCTKRRKWKKTQAALHKMVGD